VRVTVLGKSPSWQDAGGACSGYLVEEDKTLLLVDCGNGVFAKLRERVDYPAVDAIVISHLHADHFFDLVSYAHALVLAPRQQPVAVAGSEGTQDPARPRLIVPPGGGETMRRTTQLWGDDDLIETAFAIEEYDPDGAVEVGPLRLRFAAVPHYVPTYAIDVTASSSGARFTFGADCSPNEELVELARDTDLLVIEATLPRPERSGVRGHLTAGEAGDHARRAGARRVVLTHVSDELDAERVQAEGSEAFGGPVEVARGGLVCDVTPLPDEPG
jgi:ribonuclease BN (tRNA processing enzyme)